VADVIDALVLFDAVLRPIRIELKLVAAFLFRLGDRDEIRTGAASLNHFVCYPLIAKPKWRVGSSKGELMIGFLMTT
jgi:hypothetical protein